MLVHFFFDCVLFPALLAHDVYHLIQPMIHPNGFSLHLMCQLYPWITIISIDKLPFIMPYLCHTSFELFPDTICVL